MEVNKDMKSIIRHQTTSGAVEEIVLSVDRSVPSPVAALIDHVDLSTKFVPALTGLMLALGQYA